MESEKFTLDATVVRINWADPAPHDINAIEVDVWMMSGRGNRPMLRASIPRSFANHVTPGSRLRITIEPITSDAGAGEGENK